MQWIECERCLHISPNPNGQQAPMTQTSKTANLLAGCETMRVRCDDGAFKPPPKKAPKPLCIADLGEEVQASATDCESSGGGIRTCGCFQGKELHSLRRWGQTGDNFSE